MTILDPDVVESTNLTGSVLFRITDAVGRNKAEVAAEAVRKMFPDTTIEAFPVEIADFGLQRMARQCSGGV